MSKLLVVDDEQSICWGLSRLGESLGHEVVTRSSAEDALETVEQGKPDVIVLDVRLPGMDGLTAIKQFRERGSLVPIIVITAYGDLRTAVEAVRNGAFEYLVKPFDLEQVQRALVRALENGQRKPGLRSPEANGGDLIGKSPAMQEVFKRIALVAPSDAGVLLSGESGTGKELVARAIHTFSSRSERPFVAVNVASLSSSLAESELFGHIHGAFTGADKSRIGILAQANGGTLFLDEVADIPLNLQVKLLRALEYGEVAPVGADTTVRADFRVVSATHQNLIERVKEGRFRHDLYFRLCSFQIDLPPLRQRGEDIVVLADHFLDVLGRRGGIPRPTISPEARAEIEARPWHGNVRELRNAMEHGLILARGGAVLPEHLPPPVAPPHVAARSSTRIEPDGIAALVHQWAEQRFDGEQEPQRLYDALLELVEPSLFRVAMEKNHGQCAAAARALGLHRTTLRKKLDQYGIDS